MTEAELRGAIYHAAMTLATIANTAGSDPSIDLWLQMIEQNFDLQSALRDYSVERRKSTKPTEK